MKKLLTAIVIACVVGVLPILASAAPATLPANVGSTRSDLIVVTNPPTFTSTTQKGVVFCGYGQSGTQVTLYLFDNAAGIYKQLYYYGAPVTTNINSSGVFWKKVDFSSGYKKIAIYAENNGVQVVKREVTVFNPNLSEKIRDFSVNITNELQLGR